MLPKIKRETMNLWENEKELIALGQEIRELKSRCLEENEKELVIGLIQDANYLRYLNEDELKLLAKLKNKEVWQRGEK